MDTSAFNRLRNDFVKSPRARLAAALGSAAASVAYLALLFLLYLFVDLLVWKGEVPGYAELRPGRKAAFAEEWAARSAEDRAEAVKRLGLPEASAARVAAVELKRPPTPTEWELRWRAGAYLALRDRANQEAADTYLPEVPGPDASDPATRPQLGLLSLVARERDRWTGRFAGWLARWNGWAWRPGANGTANDTYLAGLFIFALGLALVRGVLLNAVAYAAALATLEAVTRLRRAIYFHIFRLGSLAVRTSGPAEAAGLVTGQVEAVREAIEASFTAPFRHPVLLVLLVVLILGINVWLAVTFVLFAMLAWLIGGQVAAYFRREARAGTRQAESALALLRESMGLMRLVKCYQMDRFNQSRVERQIAQAGRAGWRRYRGEALAQPMLVAVALVAAVGLLFLAARAVLSGDLTAPGMAVMAVALVSLAGPVAGWVDARRKFSRGAEAADAIFEFLDRKGEAAEAADAEFLPALTGRIEFRGVSLIETGTGRRLLDDVSFAVPAGGKVAVVGSDPTETHALVYLLPRFLDPTAGEIRIEDKNIRWVTHESLRAQVAVVMQDDLVFTDTVANNIKCGDPGYTLPQVIEAAKLAHAHQFVERLPQGYETVVGGDGVSLTPGQRFRVALARALLRDPNVLVLEEPFGPVDEDTLALLDDTLERVGPGRTIFFLAHRLSTLRSVHRVFLLRGGKLEAAGSHRDLWQNNDQYRRLQVLADATDETAALSASD
ncbi:ABC transporter ATP-binding protein [bacterium]|nr:ABC transporter ATP-binding protein [bacterium]